MSTLDNVNKAYELHAKIARSVQFTETGEPRKGNTVTYKTKGLLDELQEVLGLLHVDVSANENENNQGAKMQTFKYRTITVQTIQAAACAACNMLGEAIMSGDQIKDVYDIHARFKGAIAEDSTLMIGVEAQWYQLDKFCAPIKVEAPVLYKIISSPTVGGQVDAAHAMLTNFRDSLTLDQEHDIARAFDVAQSEIVSGVSTFEDIDRAQYKDLNNFLSEKLPTQEEAYTAARIVDKHVHESSILTEAHDLINGDRAEAYGPVEEQFTKVGNVSAELVSKKEWAVIHDEEIIPATVIAKIMVATKLVRESYKPSKDNRRDAGGYMGLWDKLEESE